MKNILNTKTDGTPALLSNVNESGNSLYVNGTEISSSSWIGEGTYTFTVGSHTYTISKAPDNVGNYQLLKVSDYTYQFVKENSKRELLDFFYPVGSYYESSDTTFDPNVTWGGTWELETEGLVHVSAGENYEVSSNAQDGGEATHTLTVDEMPSHNHGSKSLSGGLHLHGEASPNIIFNTSGIISAGGGSNTQFRTPTNIGVTSGARSRGNFAIDATHTHDSNGGGKAHNNMQPYKIVNRWHRVA
jgi:microcystin-dependent protein